MTSCLLPRFEICNKILSAQSYRAACQVDESENSQRQFSDSLSTTLTALTQNMESLQSNLSEEEMMAALAGLNVAQPKSDEGKLTRKV